MSRCKLEEFISYEQPAKYIVDSDQYDDSYETPVLTAGKSFILGYTDETNNIFDNLPVIIFDDFTTSVQFVDFPFKVKSSAMKLLKNTEQADIKYCYYLLKFLQHTPENHKRQWLSATSQNIVELPTIEEQKNIVKKLDKILEVIDNQNKQLELLDEAIKARFVEMFGEYETSVKLSRYIKELRAGKSLAGKTKCKNKVLKTGAATFGFFDKEQYKYYPVDYVPNPLHKVEDGDVIISRMNTPELVGSCSYVFEAPEDMYYPDRLWKTIITEDTNPIFLWQLMWQQDIRKQIKENSFGTSGTMNNISKVKLLNIKAIDVPLELQKEYASFVEEIDKSRSRIQKSLEASQELFDSLIQEYFG